MSVELNERGYVLSFYLTVKKKKSLSYNLLSNYYVLRTISIPLYALSQMHRKAAGELWLAPVSKSRMQIV